MNIHIQQTPAGFELQFVAHNSDDQSALGGLCHNLEQGKKCKLTVAEDKYAHGANLPTIRGSDSIRVGRLLSAKIIFTFE